MGSRSSVEWEDVGGEAMMLADNCLLLAVIARLYIGIVDKLSIFKRAEATGAAVLLSCLRTVITFPFLFPSSFVFLISYFSPLFPSISRPCFLIFPRICLPSVPSILVNLFIGLFHQ